MNQRDSIYIHTSKINRSKAKKSNLSHELINFKKPYKESVNIRPFLDENRILRRNRILKTDVERLDYNSNEDSFPSLTEA